MYAYHVVIPGLYWVSGECSFLCCFFFNDTATTEIYTLSLHDALPIYRRCERLLLCPPARPVRRALSRCAEPGLRRRLDCHGAGIPSRLGARRGMPGTPHPISPGGIPAQGPDDGAGARNPLVQAPSAEPEAAPVRVRAAEPQAHPLGGIPRGTSGADRTDAARPRPPVGSLGAGGRPPGAPDGWSGPGAAGGQETALAVRRGGLRSHLAGRRLLRLDQSAAGRAQSHLGADPARLRRLMWYAAHFVGADGHRSLERHGAVAMRLYFVIGAAVLPGTILLGATALCAGYGIASRRPEIPGRGRSTIELSDGI